MFLIGLASACYWLHFAIKVKVMRQGQKKDDFQMSREEYKKLKKSMKDEKFHELLGDYVKEISDPKNMGEYDQYLQQLKTEGELPEVLLF